MTEISRRSFLAAAAVAPAAVAARGFAAESPGKTFGLGLVSYNVAAGWDLPTVLRICKEAGIAAFEARTTHKHGVEPSLTADQRADVKKQFADAGVVFWGCGSVCEFHSADPAVVKKNVEDCKRFAGLVKDLGGKGVKVRPNGVAKGMTAEQACDQIGKALIECGQAAADAGVEIWVEVHGAVTQLPANMKRIMDACSHPAVGVCWNSNGADLIDKKLDAGFEMLARHIKSCHINDLDNDKKGVYPYRDLFRKLKRIGYDRYTMIEFHKSLPADEGAAFLKKYKETWAELCKG